MNQNLEQLARYINDRSMLLVAGWQVQFKQKINLSAGTGFVVREYQTDIGPADYVLFVDEKPMCIIEAKRAEEEVHLIAHKDQNGGYAKAKLKILKSVGQLRH